MEETNLDLNDPLLELKEQSFEAERNLLATFIEYQETFREYRDRLTENSFLDDRHKLIFKTLEAIDDIEADFDSITLQSHLEEFGFLEAIGTDLLNDIYQHVPGQLSAGYYVDRVIKLSQRRKLSDISVELYNSALNRNPNIGQIIANTQEELTEVLGEDNEVKISDLKASTIIAETFRSLAEGNNKTKGFPTGFATLDAFTNGFKPGELIIIAGRPGSGKSTFAMNVCEKAGYKDSSITNDKGQPLFSKPVVVFTLEMPSTQVMMRSLAAIAGVSQKKLQESKLNQDDWRRIHTAAKMIAQSPNMYIDDSSYGLTVEKVRARVRAIAALHPDPETGEPSMGMIMVDYLQLLESDRSFRERHLLIAHIAKSLKALAREFNCPVLALSQLNRNVETRGEDSRPTSADLRESGAIEQDADIIIMVHRPETNAPPEKREELKGKAELIITKNRQGETGTVYCRFEGAYSRFVDDGQTRYKVD